MLFLAISSHRHDRAFDLPKALWSIDLDEQNGSNRRQNQRRRLQDYGEIAVVALTTAQTSLFAGSLAWRPM